MVIDAPDRIILIPPRARSRRGQAIPGVGLGADSAGDPAGDPAVGLWRLARRTGAPADLVAAGFDPAAIGEVAATVAAAPLANPRPVTEDGVREILAAACAGAPPA